MHRRAFMMGSLAMVPACAPMTELGTDATHPSEAPVPAAFRPRVVDAPGLAARQIHVFPDDFALYWTHEDGRATRYTVGIGQPGRYWGGRFRVGLKREWPSWTPTANMIRREPEVYGPLAAGLPGGPDNPLGARALYLFRAGGVDSMLRIHGTPDVAGIGRQVSNGCVRMANAHVMALYPEVPIGTRVVLHGRGVPVPA